MKTTKTISTFKLFTLAIICATFGVFTSCTSDQLITPDEESVAGSAINARGSGPSASGHGTLSFDNVPLDGEGFRQFTFHARENRDGTVSGNGLLVYSGGEYNRKFDINCLNIIDNKAIMSGVVTQDNDNPNAVGTLFYFIATDNGEGANADADQISTLLTVLGGPFGFTCNSNVGLPLYDIEGGNIQVRE